MKFKKILIAVDESPAAEKIAANGFQLAQQLNAEVALISIVDTTLLMTDGDVTPRQMAEIEKDKLMNTQRMILEKVFNGYKAWTFIEEGKPFEMILKSAEEWDADIIVLGTHGRTGISHLLTGSVAEKVIRHSTKPLIIIPTK